MAEDLAGVLESSLNVTLNHLSTAKQHPRYSQFKPKSHKISQEERRKLTLEAQKKRRYDFQSHVRKLVENDFKSEDVEASSDEEEMEWAVPKIKPPRAYKNQIMLSEWMVDIPDEFEANWLIVPCPVGKRSLVVASQGRTKVYSKSGFKMAEFPSRLPGGFYSTESKSSRSSGTILDCLWNEQEHSYYVLDVQCWNGMPLLGCEAQFRFSWLHSKFSENPDICQKSAKNRYPFIPLPYVDCSPKSIHDLLLETASSSKQLDGLLFYHKLGFYIPGSTPLVGWLKPYMLPEILHIPIPDCFDEKRPTGYVNLQQHLNKKTSSKVENRMDVASS